MPALPRYSSDGEGAIRRVSVINLKTMAEFLRCNPEPIKNSPCNPGVAKIKCGALTMPGCRDTGCADRVPTTPAHGELSAADATREVSMPLIR